MKRLGRFLVAALKVTLGFFVWLFRAYRIGQTQDVTVIRMLAEHTIEQKIVTLQDCKRNISDRILQGTGTSNTLTYEEIMEMVSPF